MKQHLRAMHEEKLLEEEKRKKVEICNQSEEIKEMKNFFEQSCNLSKEAKRSKMYTNASGSVNFGKIC